ncbi:MAG TPA: SAF domain-containing protein, partial [Bauldia sp.]|nr:SAF domain-containing protein [Bauldia sp.]
MTSIDPSVLPMPGLSDRAKTPRVLRLHPDDNLVVSIDPILPGAVAEGVTAVSRVPKGHKMATAAIPEGAQIRKFGQIIGFAKVPIRPGEHIHEHNCGVHDFARDYRFAEAAEPERVLPVEQRRTFQGYKRANGKVGTRNYVGILTSVNC